MTDTEATGSEPTRSSSSSSPAAKGTRKKGPGTFLREVIAELRKVVYPTRQELLTYTAVVIVFVVVVMIFVSALDFGFGKLISWAFNGS